MKNGNGVEKRKRLALVEGVLKNEDIPNQESLKKRLTRAGLTTSQASLSRDLKELGAIRIRKPDGAFAYALPEARPAATSRDVFERRFAASVTGMRRTGFVVLLFTPPGEGQLIGRLLDQVDLPGLAGTIAGDDTVACFADSTRAAGQIEKTFNKIIS